MQLVHDERYIKSSAMCVYFVSNIIAPVGFKIYLHYR